MSVNLSDNFEKVLLAFNKHEVECYFTTTIFLVTVFFSEISRTK